VGLRDRFVGQGRGRVVPTASTATEYSYEGDPTAAVSPAESVFTAALVQGLRTGAADTDHDRYISVDDARSASPLAPWVWLIWRSWRPSSRTRICSR
jgi:hypothetical protein